MHFVRAAHEKTYGPFHVPPDGFLYWEQQRECFRTTGLWAKVISSRATGMWVVSTCTRLCRHAVGISGGLSLASTISRLLDEVRVLDEVYIPSDRRGLTRHVGTFQGRISGEAPATHDPPTMSSLPASPPGHSPALPPARPCLPGSPHGHSSATNPHPPAPRRGSMGQHEAAAARPHAGTLNLGCGRVGVRGHGSSWGATRGARTYPLPGAGGPPLMVGGSWVYYSPPVLGHVMLLETDMSVGDVPLTT